MKGPLCGPGSEGKVDGASPRGFLRFLGLTGLRPEGCGIALRAMSIYAAYGGRRCQRQRKPYNRACGALEMHSYPRLRRYFPRRGKFALLSASELISISRHKGAKTSPSGGRCRRQKGCISNARRAVGLFSSGRSPVVWFSLRYCHKLKLTPPPSAHSPTTLAGWQRNWIYRGASRPENPVTCFPAGQRWCRKAPKGALPQAA